MTTPAENTPREDGTTKGSVAPAAPTSGAAPSPATSPGVPAPAGSGAGATAGANPMTVASAAAKAKAKAAAGPAGADQDYDSTWIYDQLGLSPEAYKGDPAPDAANLPSSAELQRRAAKLDLDYDALRPGDPKDSPFPPGSLGGGVVDPPARKFEGFPAPGSARSAQPEPAGPPDGAGARAGAPAPTAAAQPRVAVKAAPKERAAKPARTDMQPDGEDNPFKIYDERQATGDIALPTHTSRPTPAPVRAAATPPSGPAKLSADSLTAEKVLKQRRRPPGKGWRKGLLATTGINLGPSAKELKNATFEERVRTEIPGCHRLAVISLKGGVGKTTSAAALGSMFASLRGDRVIAVDANPDRGTLGDKIVAGTARTTVRDFVNRSPQLTKYSLVREFTAQAESRLEVLASESDPLASLAFSENDYRVIADILERFYNLILTDCGTGLLHSAMVGVLAKADQVVIVSSASLDGARSASATLDWLEAHGYSELARESVTVVTSVRPQANTVHLDEIIGHFAKRTRAVVSVPYDAHLAEGGQIDLARLSKGTYQAYLELAAELADAFPRIGMGQTSA